MAEISYNSILDGVSLALKAAVPEADIYAGDVVQGLDTGDFNVVMRSAGEQRGLGRRRLRTPEVEVIYYPEQGMEECCAMAQRLSAALEDIVTPEGDALHCSSCTWTVEDQVLRLRAGYRHFVFLEDAAAQAPEETERMEEWSLEQKDTGKTRA